MGLALVGRQGRIPLSICRGDLQGPWGQPRGEILTRFGRIHFLFSEGSVQRVRNEKSRIRQVRQADCCSMLLCYDLNDSCTQCREARSSYVIAMQRPVCV